MVGIIVNRALPLRFLISHPLGVKSVCSCGATSDLLFVRVYAFLSTLYVCELQQVAGQQPIQGCSWLELLSYFELLGGHSSTIVASAPQESITKAIAGFRRTLLHVADVCLDATRPKGSFLALPS